MTTLAQLTAAPLEFSANGKTYRIHPLVDKDFGELLAWVQSEIVASAERMIAQLSKSKPLSDTDRQMLLREAFEAMRKVTLSSPEFNSHLMSLEGGIRLAWCALRHCHPDIGKEEVTNIMMDPNLGKQLMDKIDELRKIHNVRPTTAKSRKKALRQAKKRPMPLQKKSIESLLNDTDTPTPQ